MAQQIIICIITANSKNIHTFMSELQQRKEMYYVEIRKQHRQQIFRDLRSNLVLRIEVTSAMKTFLQQMQPVMPEICVEYYHLIDEGLLNTFLSLIMNNELRFTENQQQKLYSWYFDCKQVNNLKFAANMCNHEKADHRFGHFFHSTVEAYEPQFQLYLHMVHKYGKTRCLIRNEGDQSPQTIAISNLNKHENMKNIRALLDFWGSYIGNTMDSIFIETFQRVLKLFNLFAEYTDILSHQESYSFIRQTIKHIRTQNSKKLGLSVLIGDCWEFVKNVQRRMPYMFRLSIKYGLNYPELGQIMTQFYMLQKDREGLFIETIFSCQNYLKQYIVNMLRDSGDSLECKKAGLKVVNLLYHCENVVKILYIEGFITINSTIVNELIYNSQMRVTSVITLYNAIDEDIETRFLVKIFEAIEYGELLKDMGDSELLEIFQFLVKVMQVYDKNAIIYDKLLLGCDIQQTMREYYRNKTNQKGYADFAKLVERNIDFFMSEYPTIVRKMGERLEEMQFEGVEEVIKRIHEAIDMKNENVM